MAGGKRVSWEPEPEPEPVPAAFCPKNAAKRVSGWGEQEGEARQVAPQAVEAVLSNPRVVEERRLAPPAATLFTTSGNSDTGVADAERCACRYLRANSGDVVKAGDAMAATLQWRRETNPSATECAQP